MTSVLGRVLATLLLGLAGVTVLTVAPASAAQCTSGGVSVAVDFDHGAGGGLSTACDAGGGGKYASSIFRESGFTLTYAGGQAFVCKVSARPADANCSQTAPADAYWGLFWAKPGSSTWSYSTLGVASLKVPEGGAVAFAFQDGGSIDYPGVAPGSAKSSTPTATPTPTPTPTKRPTQAPTKKPTKRPTGKPSIASVATQAPGTVVPSTSAPRSSGSATPSPSTDASPSATTSTSAPASPSASPTTSGSVAPPTTGSEGQSTDAAPVASEPADPADDGLPTWVGPVVLVLLFAAGGTAAVVRRRRNPSP